MALDFVTNQEIILTARRNLTQDVWDYLSGGAESETTMRRNRLGFDSLALRPRVLVDVSKVDTSTTFLGHKLRIPVMLAPIGSLQTITPEGGVAVAKAAAQFGSINFVSSVTQPTLEEIAASTDHPKIFQLYVRGGLNWCEQIIERVKDAGYKALCLTVDTAHYSRRERQMMNRWLPPSKRVESNRIYQAMLTWEMMDAIRKMARPPCRNRHPRPGWLLP
jgi:isopentenyl diphosphate isomerase/L-lactate dehydrogenase-like FMN-dependent dehydrogenase